MQLTTPQLLLRQFRDSDLEPLIAMGQDPVVMKHFVSPMTREQTIAMYGRITEHWEKNGFGVFAIEIPGEVEFAGFIGLIVPRFEASFTPCIEILWRLIPSVHNKGYCTEAARACIDWGFNQLHFKEILSFAVPQNIPSWRVMEKIGMQRIGEFDHPLVEDGHALKRHLVYAVKAGENRVG